MKRISGTIVDVVRREEYPGTIEIERGRIRRIRRDAKPLGRGLLMPGFVDAHIHIESSMLPPAEFARFAVLHGTVATVSDPHEIANVLGIAGVNYMIADGARTPFRFHFGAPSCVPATSFETAGAKLSARDVARLLAKKEIFYLSEVMNFPGVLNGDPALKAMIAAAKRVGKPVDGHAPGLRGKVAKAYAAAGISTDHECFTLPEAKDKLAAGMKILIREGSAARNFAALAPLLKTNARDCMFCCDDLHPDLLMVRQVDEHVRRALALGADRFDVLACASVNPVRHYGLKVGLLQEGDSADFIEVSDWKRFRVQRTWLAGKLVADRGRTLIPRRSSRTPNQFRAKVRKVEEFAMPFGEGMADVMGAINGQLVTTHLRVPGKNVAAVYDRRSRKIGGHRPPLHEEDVLKIAVVNRYEARAPIATAWVKGFGLRNAAIASSVAHDSHNVIAVGSDDQLLADAVNEVIRARGGMSFVSKRKKRVLPLPIAGLMSNLDGRVVARRYTELDRLAKRAGSKLDAPFMTLSFMALLVIPELKLSDRGLFSAKTWSFVRR